MRQTYASILDVKPASVAESSQGYYSVQVP